MTQCLLQSPSPRRPFVSATSCSASARPVRNVAEIKEQLDGLLTSNQLMRVGARRYTRPTADRLTRGDPDDDS